MPRKLNTPVKVNAGTSVWRRGRCVNGGETMRVSEADARHLEKRGLARRI
jgi:hypothetical protein